MRTLLGALLLCSCSKGQASQTTIYTLKGTHLPADAEVTVTYGGKPVEAEKVEKDSGTDWTLEWIIEAGGPRFGAHRDALKLSIATPCGPLAIPYTAIVFDEEGGTIDLNRHGPGIASLLQDVCVDCQIDVTVDARAKAGTVAIGTITRTFAAGEYKALHLVVPKTCSPVITVDGKPAGALGRPTALIDMSAARP